MQPSGSCPRLTPIRGADGSEYGEVSSPRALSEERVLDADLIIAPVGLLQGAYYALAPYRGNVVRRRNRAGAARISDDLQARGPSVGPELR